MYRQMYTFSMWFHYMIVRSGVRDFIIFHISIMEFPLSCGPMLIVHLASILLGSLILFPYVPLTFDGFVRSSQETGNAAFALDLLRHVSKSNEGKNVFFSPASISCALAMTYLGARGSTAEEMRSVMKVEGLSEDEVHQRFEQLLKSVTDGSQPFQLNIANRLFAEKSYKFLDEFLARARTHYSAEATNLDFVQKAAEAKTFINDWVETQTNSKITNLIPDGVLGPLTRLVLVNAIYFKGRLKNAATYCCCFC